MPVFDDEIVTPTDPKGRGEGLDSGSDERDTGIVMSNPNDPVAQVTQSTPIPDAALIHLRTMAATIAEFQKLQQAYVSGVLATLGLKGDQRVDLAKGEFLSVEDTKAPAADELIDSAPEGK